MIKTLRQLVDQFGDPPIEGGCITDDTPPRRVIVLDKDGCETRRAGDAAGFFLES